MRLSLLQTIIFLYKQDAIHFQVANKMSSHITSIASADADAKTEAFLFFASRRFYFTSFHCQCLQETAFQESGNTFTHSLYCR